MQYKRFRKIQKINIKEYHEKYNHISKLFKNLLPYQKKKLEIVLTN
jgi:hypothetical protein